jgi:asparaginyl-tRNA synthetase
MPFTAFFRREDFICLHAPIITANDAEGAGEIFRVTTLDPLTHHLNEDKTVDYSADFFGKKPTSPSAGSLKQKHLPWLLRMFILLGPLSGQKIPILPGMPPSFG